MAARSSRRNGLAQLQRGDAGGDAGDSRARDEGLPRRRRAVPRGRDRQTRHRRRRPRGVVRPSAGRRRGAAGAGGAGRDRSWRRPDVPDRRPHRSHRRGRRRPRSRCSTTRPAASGATTGRASFAGGRRLQHALYGLAAVELLKARYKKPKVTAGVYYFSSHKGRQERVRIPAPTRAAIARGAGRPARRDRHGPVHPHAGRGRLHGSATTPPRAAATSNRQAEAKLADAKLAGVREARGACLTRARSTSESRRRHPRGAADEHPRRGRRRIRQDADARRADGRRRGRRRLPGRAHGGRHVHAQGGVRAARPLPPGAREAAGQVSASPGRRRTRSASRGCSRRSRISSASSPAPFTRSARVCCASGRSSPACRPGFTELDEVQDLELRQRAWRDFVTSARAAGDPDMLALLEADIRPKDLDSRVRDHLRQRRCGVSAGRRRVPGSEAGVEGAREVLEGAAEAPAVDDRPGHDVQDSAGRAAVPRAAARVAAPARSPGRRRVAARARGTASRRSSRSGGPTRRPRRSGSRDLIEPLHERLPHRRRRAVSRAVAPVRLPAVGRRC